MYDQADHICIIQMHSLVAKNVSVFSIKDNEFCTYISLLSPCIHIYISYNTRLILSMVKPFRKIYLKIFTEKIRSNTFMTRCNVVGSTDVDPPPQTEM